MSHFLASTKPLFAALLVSTFVSAFSQTSTSSSPGLASGWDDSGNVSVSDDIRATAGTLIFTTTPVLMASQFNFSIPSDHVIEGIQVDIERSRATGFLAGNVQDIRVHLTKDGSTPIGDNKAKPGNWPTSDGYTSYGGNTDLWGVSWTADEINSSTFGIRIETYQNSGLWASSEIDHIRITVYHRLSVVPITLAAFDAKLATTGSVRLTWTTASEVNNDYFTIERSADGERYEAIGDIAGSGTTNTARHYSYEDLIPLAGRSYYRLKQTDYNATFTYSPVVAIDNDYDQRPVLTVFPNPSNGAFVGIRLTGLTGVVEIPVAIYAPAGRLIAMLTLISNGESILEEQWYPDNPLPSGVYIVKAGPLTRELMVP